MEISCLQEFLANVMDFINGTFEVDRNDYSIKDGFPIYTIQAALISRHKRNEYNVNSYESIEKDN